MLIHFGTGSGGEEHLKEQNIRTSAAVLGSSFEILRMIEMAGLAGTWALDLQSRSLRWSTGMYRFLGLDREVQPAPEIFRSMIHPDDRLGLGNAYWALSAGVAPPHPFRIVRPDGTQRWVSAQAETFRDATGTPQREIGVLFDVTDREEGRILLHQSESRIVTLARALGAIAWSATWSVDRNRETLRIRFLGDEHAGLEEGLLEENAELKEVFAESAMNDAPFSTRCRVVRHGAVRTLEVLGSPTRCPMKPCEWIGFAWPDRMGLQSAVARSADAGRIPNEELNGGTVRAARELLSWSAAQLADSAGVSISTVRRLEDEYGRARVRSEARARVREAFERAGLSFVQLNDGRLAIAFPGAEGYAPG